MNTRCTVCHHPLRSAIEAAHVAGVTFREIGKRFDRSKTTIQKHIKLHVPAAAQKALDAANDRDVEAGSKVLLEVGKLKDDVRRLQDRTEGQKDYRGALTAIRELTRLVELEARLRGELNRESNSIKTHTTYNLKVLSMQELRTLRETVREIAAKPTNPGHPPAIAAPSTLTVDVSAGYQPDTAETSPVSSEESA